MNEMVNNRREAECQNSIPLAAVEGLLKDFDPITLPEMEAVALLDRMDTKYIMGMSQLCAVLAEVTADYRALSVNGVRMHDYQTLYFDTGDFLLYNQHHNGMAERYKVRARKYVDTDLSFFEVKYRTSRDRTIKSRLRIPDVATHIDGQAVTFVDEHTPFAAAQLEPKLWNDYMRITLVNKQRVERVTLDIKLSFGWRNTWSALPGVAIVEIKQDMCCQSSEFIRQMRRFGVRQMSLSKYCAGVSLVYDGVKRNNFKPQLLQVEKVMRKELARKDITQ